MRRVAKFQPVRLLGWGSFGQVWLARDTELDRDVAMKVLHPRLLARRDCVERFEREKKALAQLSHRGIVTIFEALNINGLSIIVSEFIDGVSLDQLLTDLRKKKQWLSIRQATLLGAEIAEALHHAHEQGLVHRDVKPANIMIDRHDGEPESVGKPRLTDFGLVRWVRQSSTISLAGDLIGTPAFMSPEQAEGKGHQADCRSDVYSLGVILYLLLSGRLPFELCSVSLFLRNLRNTRRARLRKLNPRIPRELEAICEKALATEPEERHSSAGAMATDLRAFLNTLKRSQPPSTRHWSRSLMTGIARAAALVVISASWGVGETATPRSLSHPDGKSTQLLRIYSEFEERLAASDWEPAQVNGMNQLIGKIDEADSDVVDQARKRLCAHLTKYADEKYKIFQVQCRGTDVPLALQTATELLQHLSIVAANLIGSERQLSYTLDLLLSTLEDYCWLVRLHYGAHEALTVLDSWQFGAESDVPDWANRRHYLFLERCRVHMALKQPVEAEASLDQFLQQSPNGVSHRMAEAFLLKAFFHHGRDDQGNVERACQLGLRESPAITNDPSIEGLPKGWTHRWILASLSNKLTDDEAAAIHAGAIKFCGTSSSQGQFLSLVKPQPRAFRETWRSQRAQEDARKIAFRELSFAKHHRLLLARVAVEVFRQEAMPRSMPVIPEDDIWNLVAEGVIDPYFAGQWNFPAQLLPLLAAVWQNPRDRSAWLRARPRLDKRLLPVTCYALGRRQLHCNPQEVEMAAGLIRNARDEAPQASLVRRIAENDLRRMDEKNRQ